eukprot:CAMPEP_0119138822 /NCGR_PEP_ID=MMETSP1310-20130426/26384_1 /TAXON_ID=464262 /ORGANISM="Genus nov. species nov., Strain RCC2339" /LENGTH=536 /DNA_ID=CAMNT_0007130051 /DNA_START=111 /DNA_END=1724 /DNA_ORIENTATION=+
MQKVWLVFPVVVGVAYILLAGGDDADAVVRVPFEPDLSRPLPRIAICGAGISGLTLAGVLSKTIGRGTHITIFERADVDQDQGYGLDLDEHGQEALARAGVYHKYWNISKPRSDSMAVYPLRGDDPILMWFRPKLLQRWFPSLFAARPETNRGALRDVLLESIADHPLVEVRYETTVADARPTPSEAGGVLAELLDKSGASLGTYDLVVDATGVHSPLRKYRVNDDTGKTRTGELAIHGVINHPENVFGERLLERFGVHGSLFLVGQGYELIIQRFGAGREDNRTAVFYILPSDEETVYRELGIDKPTSRQGGIMTDAVRLGRVKELVLRDMNGKFDPIYNDIIRGLDRVTVRSFVTHGTTTLKPEAEVRLPLICVGDSQRNCGLGAGGILAMHDCLDLADHLKDQTIFSQEGVVNWGPLRDLEQVMLERKTETHEEMMEMRLGIIKRRADGDTSLSWDLLANPGVGQTVLRTFLPTISRWWNSWYEYERRHGVAGSDVDSPIYPSVKEVWDEVVASSDAGYGRSSENRNMFRRFL